jgi:outer membrane cobalamin receptor
MKAKLSVLAAAFALALGPAIHAADEKPADKKDDRPRVEGKGGCRCEIGKCCGKEKKVMLTGSYLPQKVTRVGRITDGIHPVTVLSREDLEATGATDVASALRKALPATR